MKEAVSTQKRQVKVISKSSGNVYWITLPDDPKKPAYCSCPAWRFQRKPAEHRTCKHIKALERLALDAVIGDEVTL